jgi:hypothetical protein
MQWDFRRNRQNRKRPRARDVHLEKHNIDGLNVKGRA